MVLGTSSGAGKSLMATAICRSLKRLGASPIPFKGQNMSNNAWVDKDGREMAYSQVLQAWSAGIEPIAAMNPVLLKPKGNETSEVIHLGKNVGISKAETYYEEWFNSGWEAIQKGLQEINQFYPKGSLVLEGAGSPVEVNLQHRDLTNLRLASFLKANCVLVADIERGGVFAQLIGTLALLKPEEKLLIKGIIINRFRGSTSLFKSGKEWIEKETGIPVLGIMPWLNEIFPPEDSLDLLERKKKKDLADIEIAIVKLPFISNFSDLDPLESEPSVKLRWVEPGEMLGNPDAVIIPGSKQTLKDLSRIKRTGLGTQIKNYAKNGGIVFGICGGLQMLGKTIEDPLGIEKCSDETPINSIKGLNLIPINTIFQQEKTLKRREIQISWPISQNIYGFELHHGKSKPSQSAEIDIEQIFKDPLLGWKTKEESKLNIAGTYLHEIFDNGTWRRSWLNFIRKNKGLKEISIETPNYHKQREGLIDRLADIFNDHIDLNPILEG